MVVINFQPCLSLPKNSRQESVRGDVGTLPTLLHYQVTEVIQFTRCTKWVFFSLRVLFLFWYEENLQWHTENLWM